MRARLFMHVIAAAILLFIVPVAQAITYGEPDGDGHPHVGVLVVEFEGEKLGVCSGTLISPTVFLTAGHCTALLPSFGIKDVWVSFDPVLNISNISTLHPGIPYTHPGYGHDFARENDLGVVVFLEPISGIEPASLPTEGLLDGLGPRGLREQQFTAVGYGMTEPSLGGGPPVFSGFGVRRVSTPTFNALNKGWLRLSQNNATGNSGTCTGDSGGPNFLGAGDGDGDGDGETDIIVAITSTGDSMCQATNVTYRLDTPSARQFLGQYVALP